SRHQGRASSSLPLQGWGLGAGVVLWLTDGPPPSIPPLKGERLSELSSFVGESGSGVSGFGVEPDEEFSGQSDADLHPGEALVDEALTEVGEAGIGLANDVGDQHQQ